MNRKRISAALAGLTIGLMGTFSVITSTQAVADSPWDTPPHQGPGVITDVLSAPGGGDGIAGVKDPTDSPWD
jgi:hypothetical protein